MKKRILALLLVLLLGVLVVGCGQQQEAEQPEPEAEQAESEQVEPIVVKFAHEEIPGSVQDMYAQKFKEVLEEKTGGKIQVQIFPIGQLGDATQQCELLQNGGIEFGCVSPGNTGTIVPENQLFSLHFLFSDNMDVNAEVMKRSKALNEDLNALYLEKKIKVLAYWTEGFMQWTSSTPLNKPEDFKGFKMRTMPSPMIVAAYEAYGANPTPMPYMQVYSGLQLKMIDGQENPLFAIEEMHFYEVQNYLTLASSNLYVTTTAVNPDFFDSLSPDLQQAVLDTVEELRDYSFEIQEKLNSERLEKIKAAFKGEVVTLTPEQIEAFRAASMPARDRYVEMVGDKGKAILGKLVKEVEEIEASM